MDFIPKIYKYFFISYDYCITQITKFCYRNISPEMVMFGMRCTWYVINTPVVIWIRKTFFTKRHRKTDLRHEPVLDENSERSWVSVCGLYDEKACFTVRNCFRKLDSKKTFELEETYYQPAQTYLDSTTTGSQHELYSISLRDSDAQDIHRTLFDTKISQSIPLNSLQGLTNKNESAGMNSNLCRSKMFLYQFVNNEKMVKIVSITPYHFNLMINQSSVVSKVKFLDIQYHHPNMSEPLILELSKEYYFTGNQLFSDAFVYRMLLYQPFPFIYDERYTLEIMDHELETITLKSSEYLMLEKTSYRVI